MKPVVNVDVKMKKSMMNALNLYEVYCICNKIENCNYEDVVSFLSSRVSDKIAKEFKSDFLYQ